MNTVPLNVHQCNPIPPAVPVVSEPEDAETNLCSICYESLSNNCRAAMFPCTHIYHKHCIGRWFKDPKYAGIGCPVCKRKITHCLYPEKTPLHVAAAEGRSDIVNGLLEHGANANASTKDGITALHCAAGKGDEATVRCLVKYGANVNALTTDERPETPLQLAMLNGHEAAMIALIDSGADINHPAPDKRLPLHIAAAKNSLNAIAILLDKGANINASVRTRFHFAVGSKTPLHFAVEHGQHNAIRLLLDRGANINAQSSWLPKVSDPAMALSNNILKFMRGTDTSTTVRHGEREERRKQYGKTPLHIAIDTGQAQAVDLLLTAGAATNVLIGDGESLWSWTNGKNKLTAPIIRSLARAICNSKAPCDDMRAGLLGALLKINDWNLFDQLLANTPDADINKLHYPGSRKSAFFEVVKEGQKEKIQAMITLGADVNARDHRGWTPLHCAVYSRHGQDAIKVLVASDVNAKNNKGQTPLHLAANSGKSEIIDQLIARGAFVNATTGRTGRRVGVTPDAGVKDYQAVRVALGVARFKQECFLRGGLLHNGRRDIPDALVKIDNIGMMTPLHYAAHEGHVKAVQHLLVRGASINERTQNGMTPLKLAESALMRAEESKASTLTVNALLGVARGPGLTAAEAKVKSYSDIINLLKRQDAQPLVTPEPSMLWSAGVQAE